MISYPFILEIAENILTFSKAIQGRVYYAPLLGAELNSDELNQVIDDLRERKYFKKYPLALILPPVSIGSYAGNMGEWQVFNIVMYFLTTSYADGLNHTKNANKFTGTSKHAIHSDWDEMRTAAVSFVSTLHNVIIKKRLFTDVIRLSPGGRVITPVSLVGKDRSSGVMLQLSVEVWNGCEIEDYAGDVIDKIIVPPTKLNL